MPGPTSMHFNIPEQRQFVTSHGISATWYKNVPCPCLDRVNGSNRPECPLCGGFGRNYYDPQTIEALVTSLSFEKSLLASGTIDEVLINCTVSDQYAIADHDRFILGNEIIVELELLKRGALRAGGASAERLTYRYPVEVVYAIDFQDLAHQSVYVPGTDLDLVADPSGYIRQIHWLTTGPTTGTQYAIRYRARAEFVVFLTQPRIRVEGEIKQATFCRLRRVTPMRGDV